MCFIREVLQSPRHPMICLTISWCWRILTQYVSGIVIVPVPVPYDRLFLHKEGPLETPATSIGSYDVDTRIQLCVLTAWYGNTFRITGPLWKESTGNEWIALTEDRQWGALMFSLFITLRNCRPAGDSRRCDAHVWRHCCWLTLNPRASNFLTTCTHQTWSMAVSYR